MLIHIAHVLDLRYHLFSLPTLVTNGDTFEGRPTGIIVKLKSERSIMHPLTGYLYSLYSYRVDCSTREVCAVLDPGKLPTKPVVSINDDHCAAGYAHEALLRKTAEQQGIIRKTAGVQTVLRGEGSPSIYQAVHTHEQKRRSVGLLWI